jgi:hypothetical protein
LFECRDTAVDACHRLRNEGVPEHEIVLKETGPVPTTTKAELAGLSVDPMVWGDVQKTFVRCITIAGGDVPSALSAADRERADAAKAAIAPISPRAARGLVQG